MEDLNPHVEVIQILYYESNMHKSEHIQHKVFHHHRQCHHRLSDSVNYCLKAHCEQQTVAVEPGALQEHVKRLESNIVVIWGHHQKEHHQRDLHGNAPEIT